MNETPSSFSPAEHRAALALAEAILPGSARVPGADDTIVARAEAIVREMMPSFVRPWATLQRTIDAAAVTRTGRRFHALPSARQDELLAAWSRDPVMRVPLGLVSLVYKFVHFDQPHVYAALGGKSNVLGNLDQPRWLSQVHKADEWSEPGDIECDVVVMGTGAGGAVVGRELAARGHAVVFVEEGEHYRRDAFDGRMIEAHRRFFRAAISVGNVAIPVYIGRLVGGSTAVNGGTCFRTPDWILDRWCEEFGTDDFSRAALEPYFARVEEAIEVAPATRPEIGPIADVISRGCDALGWSHFTINRNVRGCAGGGFCDFGCGTDARRSTNLSYIPPALEDGAIVLTGLRAERVLIENGRAAGLVGVTKSGKNLRVRARTVVLAGGSIPTPLFLLKQGIANRSGQVGRNLSLHPSTGINGLMDDAVNPQKHIPQGYGCDEFLREGQLITAAQPDVNIAAQLFQVTGHRLMEALGNLKNIAALAILIRDSEPNGRVWFDAGGLPAITYSLRPRDCIALHEGMVRAGEILLAAGAKKLWAARLSFPVIEKNDFERLRASIPAAADLGLLSYHPLGTCRMGKDPKTSVVGLDHQTHDVPGLYIIDGSTVRGPLGVNPQLTIMAMATRAAKLLGDALG